MDGTVVFSFLLVKVIKKKKKKLNPASTKPPVRGVRLHHGVLIQMGMNF